MVVQRAAELDVDNDNDTDPDTDPEEKRLVGGGGLCGRM